MGLIDGIKSAAGAAVDLMTALLGQYWFLFAGLFVFNIIDLLTRWYCCKFNNAETTVVREIIKKVGYWVVIAMAFYIAFVFKNIGNILGIDLSFSIGLGWLVLAGYLINEMRSVLENAVKLGWDAPKLLLKVVRKADNAIDEAEDEKSE